MQFVAIILVSYNSSQATRIALDSLQKARCSVEFEVIVVDNASSKVQKKQLLSTVNIYKKLFKHKLKFISLSSNLGFSGGNNVGIKLALSDRRVTHICLLNNDTLVTDFWLDRLLEKQLHFVSPVTCRADSDQSIPVPYTYFMENCFDEEIDAIKKNVYETINNFSNERFSLWGGNLVQSEPTFFCVLLSRKLIEQVGLLDEAFFPGGYEDDDYCLRAKNKGYIPFVARDVYVHHFGSGSFGNIDYSYFLRQAKKNRSYFEQKHSTVWHTRFHKPFTSFKQDLSYLLHVSNVTSSHWESLASGLGPLTQCINRLQKTSKQIISTVNKNKTEKIRFKTELNQLKAVSLGKSWKKVLKDFIKIRSKMDLSAVDSFITSYEEFESVVFEYGELCSRLSSEISFEACDLWPGNPVMLLRKIRSVIYKGYLFLRDFDGIVFLAPYPYKELEKDGYYQRIASVDAIFSGTKRVYIDGNAAFSLGKSKKFEKFENKSSVIRITGTFFQKLIFSFFVFLLVARCRRIYFHSVLRMNSFFCGLLIKFPLIKSVVDIHGVVPEEFRLYDDYYNAMVFDKWERIAVNNADICIVVTDAMQQFLEKKHSHFSRCNFIVMPILPPMNVCLGERHFESGKPVVIYAGGLQRWQKVPAMVNLISKTATEFSYKFYCPDTSVFKSMLAANIIEHVEIGSKTHVELMEIYPKCHYGLILRENIVVNRVACPTKLVEYLANGIIPVVDSPDLGDFMALGMHYVTVSDMEQGNLPDELSRLNMAKENYLIYMNLCAKYEHGRCDLISAIDEPFHIKSLLPDDFFVLKFARRVSSVLSYSLSWLNSLCKNKLFVSSSRLSVFLRNVWHFLRLAKFKTVASKAERCDLAPCDVLVQVDNFLIGGLENVVLDLNKTFLDAGMRVQFLVLGQAGEGVVRARNAGVSVCVLPFSTRTYSRVLDICSPRVVITHYSVNGLQLCADRNIPVVQVLHNAYIWLRDESLDDFWAAVEHTKWYVAVSEWVRDFSIIRLGLPPEKCLVISNGINLSAIQQVEKSRVRNELRRRWGFLNDDFVFLSIGSITFQKNHLAAVRAFHKALATCPRAKLLILGASYEKDLLKALETYVRENHLERHVVYAGTSTLPQNYYAMADGILHAAFFEGGQLSLLEGLAANLPVVTSDVGFVRHFKGNRG
jgi:GT2 family glycosyltransferase/glycosyltransferase involved in cell wall biosynthesis